MDPSIDSLKASDGSGNASVATIQSVRAPSATTLDVNTVDGIPDNFFGTMGTPHTFVDPVTNETITVISEATAVDFRGHVDGTNLEIDEIAPGYTDDGSAVDDIVIIKPTTQWADNAAAVLEAAHNDDGTLKDDAVTTDAIADGAVKPEALMPGTGTTWVWQDWTPTIIGITVGNGVLNYAKYIIIGKTCFFRIKFTFGSTTAGAGAFGFSLPATAALVGGGNPHEQIGRVGLNDATGSNFTGYCRLETGSDTNANLNVVRTDATWATSGSVNTGQPFSWAVNDSWSVDGYYQAA